MNIEENLNRIKKNIAKDITLVAVSKTKPIEDIKKAYELGHRDFGENKVQELIDKEESLPNDIRWHFIGNLQTNKVKYLVDKVYLIHSLSSKKLLKKIEEEFSKKNSVANLLIQINIGKEESKGGIFEEDLEDFIFEIEKCKYIKIKGLMAIIPKGNVEENRYYFKKMRILFNDLSIKQYKNIKMEFLSMGMTNDFETALEEGSNLIRIGEGIFGKRNIVGGMTNG
ncbi:YggS family pyridoxal phosphate-dependent enzyme [Clostridium sp. AL.422]|uniref:YggS family pyridoxal phosphate-dependent enzyme n=1 Tax=Clostridium TaxID=1485 RepID=UPI00293DFFCA|nr:MULTISPECIES: YggS family pyridoxal phosphate-dependent enzyme [unclassified Clostridium]MDV4152526.1 YggS family pyridoxal phosphate-dependent enzyme [Clostridium sp. AL.422]